MFPNFPNFKKLELSDLENIEKFTKQFPPYNDFDSVDLLIFNPGDNTAVSILNNNLVVRRQHYMSNDFLYTFLGTHKVKDTIIKLLQKSREENLGLQLQHIPEANLKSSSDLHKYFIIEEDPDNFDYILSVKELAELKGSKYYDKRNLVNRFKKLYPEFKIKSLDLFEEKTKQEIKELFFFWEQQKGRKRSETEIELIAIEKLFNLVNIIKIYGLGIYIEDKLIGFTTYHIMQDNFVMMSFEKGNTNYVGIYSVLNHETAKHIATLGTIYLNYEQHFGIPGLKEAKNMWRPVFFLKKYIVSEK